MNVRLVLLLVAALVVAGLTAILARSFLLQTQPEETEALEATRILVAGKNLPMGHLIEAGDLTWQPWPTANLHSNYLREEDFQIEEMYGRVVRYGITAGEPLTTVRMIAPGERGFLAAVLGPGMRAVTVPVTRTSGIAGFVFPGDRVDVILNHRIIDGAGNEREVGETVLKNVRVLAVDTRFDDQDKTPELAKSATLEVTPKIAEKLAIIQRLGSLSLSLRSVLAEEDEGELTALTPDETGPVSTEQTYTFETEVSRLVPPLKPTAKVLTVARGSQVQVISYDPTRD